MKLYKLYIMRSFYCQNKDLINQKPEQRLSNKLVKSRRLKDKSLIQKSCIHKEIPANHLRARAYNLRARAQGPHQPTWSLIVAWLMDAKTYKYPAQWTINYTNSQPFESRKHPLNIPFSSREISFLFYHVLHVVIPEITKLRCSYFVRL